MDDASPLRAAPSLPGRRGDRDGVHPTAGDKAHQVQAASLAHALAIASRRAGFSKTPGLIARVIRESSW